MMLKVKSHFLKAKATIKGWQYNNYKGLLSWWVGMKLEYKAFRLCVSSKNMLTIQEIEQVFLYTEFCKSPEVFINEKRPFIIETITNAGIYRTYYATITEDLQG